MANERLCQRIGHVAQKSELPKEAGLVAAGGVCCRKQIVRNLFRSDDRALKIRKLHLLAEIREEFKRVSAMARRTGLVK